MNRRAGCTLAGHNLLFQRARWPKSLVNIQRRFTFIAYLRGPAMVYNMLAVMLSRWGVMNFNIYLNSTLGEALNRLAKRRKTTRNALIRQAVEDLVVKESQSPYWSSEVLRWEGDSSFEPFEAHRSQLRAPAKDPLA